MNLSPDSSLRVTETNAAGDESDGVIWGIQYALFWIALGGVFVGGVTFATLFQSGWSVASSAMTGVIPAGLVLAWVIFKQTHPPGYDTDLLDLWLHGPGFGPQFTDPNLP